MQTMLDLAPAADEVARLAVMVEDDRMDDPTPCEEMPVAGLLDHLMGLTLAFTWAAEKSGPQGGGQPRASADALDPDWRSVLPRRLAALAQAWREPTAWEGFAEAGGVRMPAEVMGLVALDELVLHGWDLARAVGAELRCDPASAAAVLEFTRQSAADDRTETRGRIFGPVVDVDPDAPPLHRALGYAGRDPGWTPPDR